MVEDSGNQDVEENGQFGDDFDDFEEGGGDLDQDDFGDFDDGFQEPAPVTEDTTVPAPVQPPPSGVSSTFPSLLNAPVHTFTVGAAMIRCLMILTIT